MRNTNVAIMALSLALAADQACSASFDCNSAANPVERAVCEDPGLSSKDETIASLYRELRQRDPSRDMLLEQRRWLAERNRCLDADCLQQSYDARLAQLGQASATAPSDIAPDDPPVPGDAPDDPVIPAEPELPTTPQAMRNTPVEVVRGAARGEAAPIPQQPSDARSSGGSAAAVILIGICIAVWAVSRSRTKRQRAALAVVDGLVAEHAKALALRRRQLVGTDPYGTLILKDWRKEVAYFFDTVIRPRLTPKQQRIVGAYDQYGLIESRLSAAGVDLTDLAPTYKGNDPVQYEHHCAEILRKAGWSARVTKGSGDQGSDVIADRAGVRLVLQCKLYSSPVGNKAVQEAAAARAHEFAQFAACVTNNTFTPAACALARTNAVALLHHDQLADWAEGISPSP